MGLDTGGIVYLACPYSHADPAVREGRFETANQVASSLMRAGYVVFSPISHSHPIAKYGLPDDVEFWRRQDAIFLEMSTELIVVCVEGWRESVGVQHEIAEARRSGLPVSGITPVSMIQNVV